MVQLSIVIITFNEAKNIARCLNSVKKIADEVIVVDSNSTDGTIEIAERLGARVIQRKFTGYADQKNFANSQAKHDWILSLDADEEVSQQLQEIILAVKASPAHNVYRIPRLTNYCGQWIRHCGWYPDYQTRLFNRTAGAWQKKQVHEFWDTHNSSEAKSKLNGDLLHYSFSSISEHLQKIERYTELAAREAVASGRSAGFVKIRVSPAWHFFSEYFLKLGFLDGFYGYVICRLYSYATFIKYSKVRLYNMEKQNK